MLGGGASGIPLRAARLAGRFAAAAAGTSRGCHFAVDKGGRHTANAPGAPRRPRREQGACAGTSEQYYLGANGSEGKAVEACATGCNWRLRRDDGSAASPSPRPCTGKKSTLPLCRRDAHIAHVLCSSSSCCCCSGTASNPWHPRPRCTHVVDESCCLVRFKARCAHKHRHFLDTTAPSQALRVASPLPPPLTLRKSPSAASGPPRLVQLGNTRAPPSAVPCSHTQVFAGTAQNHAKAEVPGGAGASGTPPMFQS